MVAKKMTLDRLAELMMNGFHKAQEDMNEMRKDIVGIDGRLTQLQLDVRTLAEGQIQIIDRLDTLERAFDRDAVRIHDHERRIACLER
jgi:hypothetical protein